MTEARSMWGTNLKVGAVVIGTIMVYTMLANAIPQVQSEVPEELTLGENVTPDELAAAGEQIYAGAGACATCHGTGTRAPNLLTDEAGTGAIGARCGSRVPGQACKEYLHASLVTPNEHVVEGYLPIMPDVSRTMSAAQIWALVAYLESVGGTITVTADDVRAADATPGTPVPAAGPTELTAGDGPATQSMDPHELMSANQCLVCHRLGAEGGPIGPPFDGIGARLNADGIRRAILDPAADTTPGYEAVAGVMPANFGSMLTAAQLESITSYLAGLR
jgi:mono/diheme cytochrome c family protein